jgi:hypothetical protein
MLKLLSEPGDNYKGSKSTDPVYFLNLEPGPTCYNPSDCLSVCLASAGRHRYHKAARKRKTDLFYNDTFEFFRVLHHDLELVSKRMFNPRSKWFKKQPYVRLNGLSDIAWERINIWAPGYERELGAASCIMNEFPLIRFYDYTKNHTRFMDCLPSNYRLVFSYSASTAKHFKEVVKKHPVAVVFKGEPPDKFKGYPVIDGDNEDIRFFDQPRTIIGLRAKGRAKTKDNKLVTAP